jgi:DNA-binding response OmpR family regulator
MTKPNVLIIDDDQEYLAMLAEALSDNFNVYTAKNLLRAEHLLSEIHCVDIALVDENIGSSSGSNWIEKNSNKAHAPKSFVLYSGLATEEAILKGLECGADDFLAKPISLHTLQSKLEKLIHYQSKIQDFESELKTKQHVLNISMVQASKYSSCMQLTSKINNSGSYEQIRDHLFAFFYAMKLSGCVAFYPIGESPLFFSSKNGLCSPVELEVMELLKHKPKSFTFGNRTIVNHPLASILLLNLELDCVESDIYLDAFTSVIECIGTRMAFITYQHSINQVQHQLAQAMANTKKMVEISKHHQQEMMNEMVIGIGESFHVLDLSTDEINYLTKLVHNALKKHTQDDVNFMEVTNVLDDALLNVAKLKSLQVDVSIRSN